MKKTIGIIGGMGPLATVDLFKCIVQMTRAKTDNDHIPILIDNNTKIPDRTAAILARGCDPLPELIKSATRLEKMGADILIMPCNTAHYFYDDIVKHINIPFINMIDETVSETGRRGIQSVGVLSTEGVSQSGVYESAYKKRGITVYKPDDEQQKHVTQIIYEGIKAGNLNIDTTGFKQVVNDLFEQGAEALVLGCTELPIAFESFNLHATTLNPTRILAAAAIRIAGGEVCENL